MLYIFFTALRSVFSTLNNFRFGFHNWTNYISRVSQQQSHSLNCGLEFHFQRRFKFIISSFRQNIWDFSVYKSLAPYDLLGQRTRSHIWTCSSMPLDGWAAECKSTDAWVQNTSTYNTRATFICFLFTRSNFWDPFMCESVIVIAIVNLCSAN